LDRNVDHSMSKADKKQADIILFHPEGETHLLKTRVLQGLPYKNYDPNLDIHLSFRAIVRSLFFCLKFKRRMVFRGFFSLGHLRILVREYQAQIIADNIRAFKPKLVLTWTDNSTLFHQVSNACNEIPFLAIANAARALWCMTDAIPSADLKYHADEYFCHGPRMKRMFEKHGHNIKKYVVCGSLIGGYFFSSVLKNGNRTKKEFDVCLISQWVDSEPPNMYWEEGNVFCEFRKAREAMETHLARYAQEHQIKVCVALRGRSGERAYYESIFNGNCLFQENDRVSFSSYEAAYSADLIVAHNSTLAVEMFAAGRKVLFVPSSEKFQLTDSIGCWHLTKPSYETFSKRIDELINMSIEAYQFKAEAEMKNIMSYDFDRPAHIVIRERLIELISPSS